MVCQGLQSCLEPGVSEPHVIFDKLANISSNSQNPNLESQQEIKNNGDSFCWSFIQQGLLNNNNNINTRNVKEEKTEEIYVHPLSKPSFSQLSTQSLEMCTEGLGSETGSNNDDEIMADLSCLSCEIQSSTTSTSNNNNNTRRGKAIPRPRKMEKQGSFPPPLTLISGSDGIKLRPHREDGRLVLKAVAFSHKTHFRAERIDGRLKLFSLSSNGNGNDSASVAEYTDEDNEEEEEEEEEGERIKESGGKKMECEIESEEFARLTSSSRCKEEGPRKNRGIINWEPVWVAIS